MNDIAVDPPEVFAEKAVPLLKEYLQKVLDIKQQLRALHDTFGAVAGRTDEKAIRNGLDEKRIVQIEFQALEQHFQRLWPAILNFSQQVSGMIDQGRITPLTKSELRLRLAELESVTTQMQPLINAYRPH